MTTANTTYENEQVKREFFEQLKGAKGFAKSSVRAFADAIAQWQTFTQNEDFSKFNKTKATAFVEWLSERSAKTKTGKIALVTQDNYLRRAKKFFEWLSGQPGYKSKIMKNEVEWLRLSKTDARIARMGTTRQEPTFEEVKMIIQSIEGKNELELRDRALICLAIITGARISALASLRMKSFNKKTNVIYQNPRDGIKTKSTKLIPTVFFPIGWDDPQKYFVEWYEYLEVKGFEPDDPLFPATLNNFSEKANSYSYSRDLLSKNFWNGAGSARSIFKKRCLSAGIPYFNPHSFRHLVIGILMENTLTEKQKKAISLNVGHESVATTFDSYGYSNMTPDEVIETIKNLKNTQNDTIDQEIPEQKMRAFKQFLKDIS